MRGNRLSVNKTKKEAQRERQFAAGGSTKMFKPQAAGKDRPGNTGKDQTAAPGARQAEGGTLVFDFGGLSQPAEAGVTSAPRIRPTSTRNYGKRA